MKNKCNWYEGKSGCPDIDDCKTCKRNSYCKGYEYMKVWDHKHIWKQVGKEFYLTKDGMLAKRLIDACEICGKRRER